MTTFERVIERLTPLVETRTWDYYIVWKLGDDPSRFVQWKGCCCSGGFTDCSYVKESGKQQQKFAFCKDTYNKHPARTNSCKALAQFPSSIALYSGVHGEAVISKQTKWLTHSNNSTQVLIPLNGSLLEIFTRKRVQRDQRLIDLISTQCSIYLKQETMDLADYSNNWPISLDNLGVHSGLHFLPPVSQASTFPSLEGSSTSSNFSNENKRLKLEPVQVSCDVSPEDSIGKHSGKQLSIVNLTEEQEAEFALEYAYDEADRHELKAKLKMGKEKYQSKNLVTERNRRKRIKDGLFALRALVPKITKMDKVAILGDAFDYIQELQQCVENYQDELRAMAEEDSRNNNADSDIPKSDKKVESRGNSQSCTNNRKQAEAEIEVSPIGATQFLLRIICKKRQGGFSRLIEAVSSLGLQVIDVNVTTLDGMLLNVLRVKANRKDIQAQRLKCLLTKLIAQITEEAGETRKRPSANFTSRD